MSDKPLFLLMADAFDGAMHDDCFYEWNKVAAAMLRAIANRIINPSDWGSYDLSVACRLQKEAAIADTWDNDKRA